MYLYNLKNREIISNESDRILINTSILPPLSAPKKYRMNHGSVTRYIEWNAIILVFIVVAASLVFCDKQTKLVGIKLN